MKKILVILFFLTLQVKAQEIPDHVLSITAEGITYAVPDIIRCTILFSGMVKDMHPKIAEQKIIEKALLDLKINTTAVFVPGESTDEDYDSENGETSDSYTTGQHIPTVSYNKSYYISLNSYDAYLKLMQASSAYALNGVKITFTISSIGFKEETKRAAREAAFKDAMAQAKIKSTLVTQTLGGTIGGLKSVQEYYNDDIDYSGNYSDYFETGKPLTLPYTCTVTVVFELK